MSGTQPTQHKINIKPEFQVERVQGEFRRTITRIVEDVRTVSTGTTEKKIITRKMQPEVELFDEGYMIYFPQGHSMFVAADDTEQLIRIGVFNDPKLVDMETGEPVPDDFDLSPKEIVERKTRNRPRPAVRGGIAEALEE
jgi:hypothetical protein